MSCYCSTVDKFLITGLIEDKQRIPGARYFYWWVNKRLLYPWDWYPLEILSWIIRFFKIIPNRNTLVSIQLLNLLRSRGLQLLFSTRNIWRITLASDLGNRVRLCGKTFFIPHSVPSWRGRKISLLPWTTPRCVPRQNSFRRKEFERG